jgi:predicted nucleic acid-binding protein
LKNDDPVAYVQKQIELNEINQARQQLRQQAQLVREANLKAQQEQQAAMLELERKEMRKLFPEWSNQEKAVSHQTKIINYAKELGYNDGELAGIARAKDLLVLDKARRFDELQKQTGEIPNKKKPVMRKVIKSKGAAPKNAPRQKQLAETRNKLKNSGSLKDAAAFIAQRRAGNVITK